MSENRRELARGNYMRLVQDNNGYEYVLRTKGTGVVVIACAFEGQLVLVEQYRASLGKNVIELPAGIVGDEPGYENEDYISAAKRELVEETGYEAENMEIVSYGPPSAGLSGEISHIIYATGLRKVGPGGGNERENITVHLVPLKEVEGFCRNRIVDSKVFSGLYFVMTRT